MGLFDSTAVKELKKDAGFIGGLIADQALGQLPPGAADEMVRSESQRDRLLAVFDSASKEVGAEKALKKATKEAAYYARMHAELRKVPAGQLPKTAEAAILDMLGRSVSA
jgi:hypothetical protein